MFETRYLKYLFKPKDLVLGLRFRLLRRHIVKNFASFEEAFDWEVKNDFKFTQLRAKLTFGTKINLQEPTTFSEKLIHRRLFSRDPIWPIVTDKISVRDWLQERGHLKYVSLVPAKITYSIDELMSLPINKPVVVKAAWASGMNLFVSSTDELKQYEMRIKKWLSSPYAVDRLIWAPDQMKRGFIVEDSIADENGIVPIDYKFHCFDGVVEFIQVDIDRFSNHERAIFNKNLEQSQWCYGKKVYKKKVKLNELLVNKMIGVAEKLATDFSYIRVDLYEYNGKVCFGELTQTHGAGFDRFTDEKLNSEYGKKWKYPI